MHCPCVGTSITGRVNHKRPHSFISTSVNFHPSPHKMAKRKVDFENRGFQDGWEAQYMFADVKGKAVCLLCGDSVAVMKEYNIKRHYETKHHDKYKHLDTTQRLQKVEEIKRSRVRHLAANLQQQLVGKGKAFIAHSLAVDESTDTSDTAQLSIFIRGVDSSLCVTEEFFGLRSMHGTTTGKDLFEEVSRCVDKMGLPWDKLVGLTTDGAPAMCSQKSGLVGKIREKMQDENVTSELTVYHCIIHQESLCGKALNMEHVMSIITRAVNFIRARGLNHRQFKSFLAELNSDYGDLPYHTEVRWLSQGKVLERFFELREEICEFMESKGKDKSELRNKKFLCEVAILCDITSHLNALNLQLQGPGRVITDMYATVRAFKTQLRLWETQILQENLSHFPHCQTMKEQVPLFSQLDSLLEKLGILGADFTRRFADFEAQKSRFELLSNPFAADVESAPSNLQMELIELQCSDTLKAKYESVGAAEFPRFIPDTMPHLRSQAAQTLSMFGSTYLCEQLFSLMKINKTSHRTRLTDEHLHSILRISSAQSLTPDIDELVTKIRHQVSGSDK
ncbi:general transcription factor II-I repeat domain-containing protein 2-like [Eleginops maclovinus]|uniref:general transcription factor II-I repeat domain-containing protein 2-like n=1 Tax=Eleginops maclovinus TaxID=56733 RepID=UPI0030810BF6